MRTRLSLLIAAPMLVAAIPPAASAQAVFGDGQGVTAVPTSRGVDLRFGKPASKAYKQIAGKRINAGCSDLEALPNGAGYSEEGSSAMPARAPRRRGRIHTRTRGDVCWVRLRKHDQLVAIVPVNARGRIYLDELLTATELQIVLEVGAPDGAPAPAPDVVALGKGRIVALDSPDGAAPAGRYGYWTDGTRVVAAALTKAGRRLFIEIERDVVRTNVLGYLNEDPGGD
jgi:hypothetical protein